MKTTSYKIINQKFTDLIFDLHLLTSVPGHDVMAPLNINLTMTSH